MNDPGWLKVITIGLVLAALAVGYFLLTGRLTSNSATKISSQASPAPGASVSASINPTPAPTPTPASAYNQIVSRNQGNAQSAQTLPRTGFPAGLAAVFSASAIIAGWGLRKFPH